MDRKAWDRLVSGAGTVLAVVLVLLGAVAIFGGNFGRNNVRDELKLQKITVAPADALTPEETEVIGDYAGEQIVDGDGAKAFSSYIGIHLKGINDGKTYSESSSEARAFEEGTPERAEADAKVQTLFRGETLRGLLLNAYGWWTISTLTMFAGFAMILAGFLLGIFAFLGFRHARKVQLAAAPVAKPQAA
jgi:hypothetical protein